MSRLKRPNWYDFQHVDLEDLNLEQDYAVRENALTNKTIRGTGVLLDRPESRVVFDSDKMTATQSGWSTANTFDGRGILETPYLAWDQNEGNQLSILLKNARLPGYLTTIITIIGKVFDESLVYEHIVATGNGTYLSRNHFREITNIMFQNLRGNANVAVDGYGSKNVGGHIVIREATSMEPAKDLILAEQTQLPDIIFRDYKVYTAGKTLAQVIGEAIGSSNDIDDLGINTTVPSTRRFPAAASTDLIYAIKFKMKGKNIQKVSILMGIESGSNWSGTLTLGIRKLQSNTGVSNLTTFIPDSEIDFDPETIAIEEISLTQADLESKGIILDSIAKPIDFIFNGSTISNSSLSNLIEDSYYMLTIRRTGSTTTGSLFIPEGVAPVGATARFSVFSSGVWTDIVSSVMWFRIFSDSLRVAAGVAYDSGIRITSEKIETDIFGNVIQHEDAGIGFASTSEGIENYLMVQSDIGFADEEIHPRTGDQQFANREDTSIFFNAIEVDVETLLKSKDDLIVLARAVDKNARSNPSITGILSYPGLAMGNHIDILKPSSDLLNHNVIGSIIVPNLFKPSIRYRIISQTIFNDGYGDIDSDGKITLTDLDLLAELDGYATNLTGGTVPTSTQKTAILVGSISILDIIKGAGLGAGSQTSVSNTDIVALSNYINLGTSFPSGNSEFTRIRLEVEPLLNPKNSLNNNAYSTLKIESVDTDLINAISVNFRIDFIPTWNEEFVELIDLRRYVISSSLDFSIDNLKVSPENGGKNNLIIPGDIYLAGGIKNLNNTFHGLDLERGLIEIELPDGDTVGEINIFDLYVKNRMKFADGSIVSIGALNLNQVLFEVSISSYAKNFGGAVDGYKDFDGYGDSIDILVATYLDQATGLLRIKAYNIVNNDIYPELRTRLTVSVSLKKSGWSNALQRVSATDVLNLI